MRIRYINIFFVLWLGATAQRYLGSDARTIFGAVMLLLFVAEIVGETRKLRAERKVQPKAQQKKPASGSLTAGQMLLIERINAQDGNATRYMIALWESIYGRPADTTRPMHEIVAEVSVALIEKSS